jgi:eukaryotic-like serine/threonine-protein kinase
MCSSSCLEFFHSSGVFGYNRATFMPIAIGQQLGYYEIIGLLGKGGMGVVYRARDTKLNRPVAIKFVSDELVDAEARRRFQREAQMASSLNHPHMAYAYRVRLAKPGASASASRSDTEAHACTL